MLTHAFIMSSEPNDPVITLRGAVLRSTTTQSQFQQLRIWVANTFNPLPKLVPCQGWEPILRKERVWAVIILNWLIQIPNSHRKKCRVFPILFREEVITSVLQKIFKIWKEKKISGLLSMIQISKIIAMREVQVHYYPLVFQQTIYVILGIISLHIGRYLKAICQMERMSWAAKDTLRVIISLKLQVMDQ